MFLDKGFIKTMLLIFVLISVAIFTIVIATGIGSVNISPDTSLDILLSKIPFLNAFSSNSFTEVDENIILKLRLPRVILGMIVGASLSVCGVAMQSLVRNQLADPYILGVSNGAGAFATLGMLFGTFSFFGIYALSISAFIGAMITIIIVYFLSLEEGRINITKLLLIGVAISMIMSGFTSVIKLSAPNALGLHNAEFWLSGSLASAKWSYIPLPLITLIISIIFLMIHYRDLNLLLLGQDTAISLGINVRLLQKQLIIVASILTGVTIAVSGTIGFVGLMVPHFTRLLVGGNHKKVVPISALIGGILVVWVDVFARVIIAPEELPVGVLTAIIGGPIFIFMLKKNGVTNVKSG